LFVEHFLKQFKEATAMIGLHVQGQVQARTCRFARTPLEPVPVHCMLGWQVQLLKMVNWYSGEKTQAQLPC
jgi:hypothetical protein